MSSTMSCWVNLALGVIIIASCTGTRYQESHTQKILRMAYEVETNPQMKAEWTRRVKAEDNSVLPDVQFNCQVDTSTSKPTSAHRLRPGDIDVIGAFGDSITAGNGLGARNAPEVALENRGESFSVGGDESLERGVITLTNILRKFNPDIRGYSHCPGTRDNSNRAWLNVAEPGGTNRNMPGQARFIIDRMINDTRIDFLRDWKLLTMFIGGNDLCSSCENWELYSPEAYGAKIREAVDIIYNEVPLVFLNLVVMFDVTPLSNYSRTIICDRLQTRFCDCALNETTVGALRQVQLGYYDQLVAISEDQKYRYKEDFAVVLQPHLRDMVPPIDPDSGEYLPEFIAPDCFHPSRLAHQSFAFWLWNNMLKPVGQKETTSIVNLGPDPNVLSCPTTASPFFFTIENSG